MTHGTKNEGKKTTKDGILKEAHDLLWIEFEGKQRE